jgi:hypothetical protein
MRNHTNLFQRNTLIRLIVMIITALLLMGAMLSLSASQASAASPESYMPSHHTVTAPSTAFTCFTPPIYDDPSYLETLLRQGKRWLLCLMSVILEKLPLHHYPLRAPNNAFRLIIPL